MAHRLDQGAHGAGLSPAPCGPHRQLDRSEAVASPRSQETTYDVAVAAIGDLTNCEVTLPARCELLGATAVRIDLGTRTLHADEPRILGGRGGSPSPCQ